MLAIAFSVFNLQPALGLQKYNCQTDGTTAIYSQYTHRHMDYQAHSQTHTHTRYGVDPSLTVSSRKLFSEPISKIIGVCFCG